MKRRQTSHANIARRRRDTKYMVLAILLLVLIAVTGVAIAGGWS